MIQPVVNVSNLFGIRKGLVGCLLVVGLILTANQTSFAQADEDGPLFEIEFDRTTLFLPCDKGCSADAGSCDDSGMEVLVTLNAKRRSSRDSLVWYEYVPETGSVTQTGGRLIWNLGDAIAGTHWLKIKMNQGFETIESISKSVEVGNCECTCKTGCAVMTLAADMTEVVENQRIMLRAVQSGYFSDSVYLSWNVANGEIVSGQGSNIIRVDAGPAGNGDLLINLEITQPSIECERLFQLRIPIKPDNENDQ